MFIPYSSCNKNPQFHIFLQKPHEHKPKQYDQLDYSMNSFCSFFLRIGVKLLHSYRMDQILFENIGKLVFFYICRELVLILSIYFVMT